MADIREILAALSPEDRAVYTQHRNEMRRSYLLAHTETIGMDKWSEADDRFLDYIDISLALLYDRAGKLNSPKDIIGGDQSVIEEKINAVESNLNKIAAVAKKGDGWQSNGVAK